jgi:hypothetical protein
VTARSEGNQFHQSGVRPGSLFGAPPLPKLYAPTVGDYACLLAFFAGLGGGVWLAIKAVGVVARLVGGWAS